MIVSLLGIFKNFLAILMSPLDSHHSQIYKDTKQKNPLQTYDTATIVSARTATREESTANDF